MSTSFSPVRAPGLLLRWIGVTLLAQVTVVGVLLNVSRDAAHMDFARFYYSAQAAQVGRPMYADDARDARANWNPPHFHLLVAPFARWPLPQAFIAWNLLGLAAIAWSLALMQRELAMTWPSGMIAFALAAAPLHANFNGQVGGLIMLPMTLAWRDLRRRRVTAGVWIGLLISLKPFLAPLGLWLLFRREWRMALVAGVTGLVAVTIGALGFGFANVLDWLRLLGTERVTWAGFFLNGTVAALLSPTTHPPTQPIWWIAVLMIIGGSLWAATIDRTIDRPLALVTMASLLASPTGSIYYWGLLVPPVVSYLKLHRLRLLRAVAIAGCLWPLAWSQHQPGLYAVALVLTWALLLGEGKLCRATGGRKNSG